MRKIAILGLVVLFLGCGDPINYIESLVYSTDFTANDVWDVSTSTGYNGTVTASVSGGTYNLVSTNK
jgi:hypothetical protein